MILEKYCDLGVESSRFSRAGYGALGISWLRIRRALNEASVVLASCSRSANCSLCVCNPVRSLRGGGILLSVQLKGRNSVLND